MSDFIRKPDTVKAEQWDGGFESAKRIVTMLGRKVSFVEIVDRVLPESKSAHPRLCFKIGDDKREAYETDWVVVDSYHDEVMVMTPDNFNRSYDRRPSD